MRKTYILYNSLHIKFIFNLFYIYLFGQTEGAEERQREGERESQVDSALLVENPNVGPKTGLNIGLINCDFMT